DDGSKFMVDYTWSTVDTFTEFAAALFQGECGIFALSLVGDAASTISALPSWVPDLTQRLRPEPLKYAGGTEFGAATNSTVKQRCHVEGNILVLTACSWDTIQAVGE